MPLTGLHDTLVKSQNPSDIDAITKVQDQLEETKNVAIKTMDALLERGEKLDDLAQKSEDLSVRIINLI